VLKGKAPGVLLVVSQTGGVGEGVRTIPLQYSLMEPGQRVIAFLNADSNRNQTFADRGVPRFHIKNDFAGLLPVSDDGTRLQVPSGMPATFKKAVEGRSIVELFAEMESYKAE
jgi:hypothetical protein